MESPGHAHTPVDEDSESVQLQGSVSPVAVHETNGAVPGCYQDTGTADTEVLCQEGEEEEDLEAMNDGPACLGRSPSHVKVTLMQGSFASFRDFASFKGDLDSRWDRCLVIAVGACYIFHPVVLALLSTVGAFVFLTPGSPEELPLSAFPAWNIVLLVSSVLLAILLVCGTIKKNPWLMVPHLLFHTIVGYLAVVVIQRGFSLSFSIFITLNFCSVFFMTIWSMCFGTDDDNEMNKCLKWVIIFCGVFSFMGVLLALMAETGSLERGTSIRGPNYRDRWRHGNSIDSGHSDEESRFGGGWSDPKNDESSVVLDHTEEEGRFGGGWVDTKENGTSLVSDQTEEESRFGGGWVDKKGNESISVSDNTKDESRFGGGWRGTKKF